jgi:hypothetical protein
MDAAMTFTFNYNVIGGRRQTRVDDCFRPLTAKTGVRVPLGAPMKTGVEHSLAAGHRDVHARTNAGPAQPSLVAPFRVEVVRQCFSESLRLRLKFAAAIPHGAQGHCIEIAVSHSVISMT